MTIIQTGRLALQLLLLTAAGACTAGTITCVPAPAPGSAPAYWIRRIAIDDHARTVNMDVVRSRTKDTETMGKMRAELLNVEETQSGEPVYMFNASPSVGAEATHLFRLFKAGDWRLMGAGVSFVGKVPALRAVEPGAVFDCKRSDLG